MFTMTNGSRVLFDPRLENYRLETPRMTREAGMIGSLTFIIYPNHPEYSLIQKVKSDIKVYLDGELQARFRPVYSGQYMRGGVTHQCEELIAMLNDIKCRPYTYSGTPSGFLSDMLAKFRAQNTSGIDFIAGTVSTDNNSETFEYVVEDYEGYWDLLQQFLPDRLGGYLKPRYVGDDVYIDFLREEDLPLSTQKIVFGTNLADKFFESDAATTFSVLIPLGAYTGTGETRTHLDIKSVNNGLDYLESAAAIALYGRREYVGIWEGINDAATLKSTGQAYLNDNAMKLVDTATLDAYDLRNTGADIRAFRWLERVKVVSDQYGVEATYPNTRMDVPLGVPLATRIQVGRTKGTLTEITSKAQKEISSVTSPGGSLSSLNNDIARERSRASSAESSMQQGINSIVEKTGINSLGQTETLYTKIAQNATDITLEAGYRVADKTELQASINVNAQAITAEVTDRTNADNTLSSTITQTASAITAEVSNKVDKSSVTITADSITVDTKTFTVDATTIVNKLVGQTISVGGLTTAGLTVLGSGTLTGGLTAATLSDGDGMIYQRSVKMGSGTYGTVVAHTSADLDLSHAHAISCDSSGVVTVGNVVAVGNSDASFNIADTAFYQSGVSAAQTTGWNNAASAVSWPSAGTGNAIGIVYPVSGGSTTTKAYVLSQGSWSGTGKYVYLREDTAQGSAVARTEIDASSIYSAGISQVTSNMTVSTGSWNSSGQRTVAAKYNGTTYASDTISLPTITVSHTSWNSYYQCTARAYANGIGYVATDTIDASSIYTSGYNSGSSAGYSSGYSVGYSEGYAQGQSSSSYSSSDLHISKSSGNVLLYLGNNVVSRTCSIYITSLVKSSNSNAWNITVEIDGDTYFYFTKLPTG